MPTIKTAFLTAIAAALAVAFLGLPLWAAIGVLLGLE